jgi:hypothetical protein
MIHPASELRFLDPELGYGLFATRPIPRGTIVWALCHRERIYAPGSLATLDADERSFIERYGYFDPAGNVVLSCDAGRYVNHSCEPTTLGVGEYLEVAIRDVAPGEQITCEYALNNLPGTLRCRCGAPACRGTVSARDVLRLWRSWDEQLRLAVERWADVPQPLLAHVLDRALVQGWMDGSIPLPSEYYVPLDRGRPRARQVRSAARSAGLTVRRTTAARRARS